jgi:hypothetical protein
VCICKIAQLLLNIVFLEWRLVQLVVVVPLRNVLGGAIKCLEGFQLILVRAPFASSSSQQAMISFLAALATMWQHNPQD